VNRGIAQWAILTGEYPPQPGGVADYTALVAHGLAAAGDRVTVYAPRYDAGGEAGPAGIRVRRLPDNFGPRGLAALDRALDRDRPDRILVQYVPHAYGYKALNLPFAAWLARRAGRRAPVWVMFHEVAFPFRWRPVTHAVLATTHRLMARLIAGVADRVFVSVPAWEPLLRAACPRMRPAEWLPVPSNLPAAPPTNSPSLDDRGRTVVGHFGTFGDVITDLLAPVVARLLARPDRVLVLFGRGGERFLDRLVARHPEIAGRGIATGRLPADALAGQLAAVDILVQPYPDGLSTRRGSAMAGLALGRPVVSNLGPLSESLWSAVRCVGLAPGPDPGALATAAEAVLALSPGDRAEMGRQAAALYRDRFGIENTLARLRMAP
jgi:glycosyltransferase involved in cell wall biosynthesis